MHAPWSERRPQPRALLQRRLWDTALLHFTLSQDFHFPGLCYVAKWRPTLQRRLASAPVKTDRLCIPSSWYWTQKSKVAMLLVEGRFRNATGLMAQAWLAG